MRAATRQIEAIEPIGVSAPVGRPGLGRCLGRLSQAIDAASAMGLDVTDASAVLAEARDRLRFPSSAYLLALIGGTGVGKSSLLNALAGTTVSRAGARRPTTGTPVAWVAATAADDLEPLIERLGAVERRVHEGGGLGDVVVLDLPDMDSIDPDHRARVEELLPRMDAVAWVVDPEKYADARIHDEFFERWLSRLDRQVIVVNKTDRLPEGSAPDVAADLERSIRRSGRSVPAHLTILTVSALGGPVGIAPLRSWLESARDAKAVVAGRLAAAARAATLRLADTAGIDPAVHADLLLDPNRRRTLLADAIDQTLRIVDLPGAERQAVAATRARARRSGAGPLSRLTSLVYRASGRQRRVADPAGYLANWRNRGSLARPVETIRSAVTEATERASPAMRPVIAAAASGPILAGRLSAAVDRVLAARGELPAPRSRLWPVLGLLQTINVVLLVISAGWLVVWLVARPPVDSFEIPGLGLIPVPFGLVVVTAVAGFIIARLLSLHAGWIGRRWARRLRGELHDELSKSLEAEAFAPLDRLETSRRALWIAARGAAEECA